MPLRLSHVPPSDLEGQRLKAVCETGDSSPWKDMYPMVAPALSRRHFDIVTTHAGLTGVSSDSLPPRSFLRDRRGTVALEFAVILPSLLLIFIGGLDLALAMLTEQQLTFVTESAARCAAEKNPNCLSVAATEAWAAQRAVILPGVSAGNFAATFDAPCGGIEVVATYFYSGFALPGIPLTAEACYPPEPPT